MTITDIPTSGHYRTYCAECGRDLGPAPAGCWWDTDEICAACDRRLREQAGLQEARDGNNE